LFIGHLDSHQVTPNLKRSHYGKGHYSYIFEPGHSYVEMKKTLEYMLSLGNESEHRKENDELLFLRIGETAHGITLFSSFHKVESPIELVNELYDHFDIGFFTSTSKALCDRDEAIDHVKQFSDLKARALRQINFSWDIDAVRAWDQEWLDSMDEADKDRILSEIRVRVEYLIHCKWNGNGNRTFSWGWTEIDTHALNQGYLNSIFARVHESQSP